MRHLPPSLLPLPLLALLIGCPPASDGPPSPGGVVPDAASPAVPGGAIAPSGEAAPGDEPPARTLDPRVCVLGGGGTAEAGSLADGVAFARARVEARTEAPRTVVWTDVPVAEGAEGVIAAWEQCVDSKAAVVVGPLDPALVAPLLPVATGTDVLWVIPQLGLGAIATPGANVLIIGEGPDEMGTVAAIGALATGSSKGAALLTGGDFGASVGAAFVATYDAAGKTSTASADLADAAAFAAAAQAAVGGGADALLVAGSPESASAVVAVLGDPAMADVHVWLVDWAMEAEVLAGAPAGSHARVHGLNFIVPRGVFEAEYLEARTAVPTATAGLGYDAAMLAAEAIEAAPELTLGALAGALTAGTALPSAFGEGALEERGGVMHFTTAHRDEFVAAETDGGWGFQPKE